ncbi:MAG: phosphomannose isomerase type II C-terminal cupin domain [Chitinophagales bacterium]|nr:phosphomannose isomerase type II C-terminal cupin domain [Chitinophagales bacterium]HAE14039.1 mannose-6-phosphate isomerase [Bacteroidota bacterium]MCB9021331.1 phosphomannose isomerase type II C-terminal cupin domain [Chitinophagales bacterium]MCB9031711.1 phosphomannose isomerase type II C-terminal cupin domain [Chitinophagales bacterium]HAE34909.1 mannose-6-phosphate isomerase [Bacteroidota bacterium]
MNKEHDIRPWGAYWVLEDTGTYKVKRIEVEPGHQLSYQYHHHRSEVWVIIEGHAEVILEGEVIDCPPGKVVQIPQGARHRIRNAGNEKVVFVEVQLGSYFGEDDIVRLDDDYERA